MEATGVREFPEGSRRGKFIRRALSAAVLEVIVPRLTDAIVLEALAAGAVSRDLCERTLVYLQARCHYGVCDPARLGPLPGLWAQVLGEADLARLDDLFARVIWAKDGDSEALDRYANEYREIIGPPPPPPAGSGESEDEPRQARRQRERLQRGRRRRGCQRPGPEPQIAGRGARAGRPRAAPGRARTAQRGPRPAGAAQGSHQARGSKRAGAGHRDADWPTAASIARRWLTRCRWPAGTPAGFTRRARSATNGSTSARRAGASTPARTCAPTPSGRSAAGHHSPVGDHQGHHRAAAGTARGARGGYVGVDGSLGAIFGPVIWVLSEGLRSFGGRLAVALFGNGATLLSDGKRPMAKVPGIKTGGGTAFAGEAVALAADELEMENLRRPRFLYCVSDGGWCDHENGVQRIRELADVGVPTVHIAVGVPPCPSRRLELSLRPASMTRST